MVNGRLMPNEGKESDMELIVINQSKLKIMLTPPDMQRYELSAEQMDCADEQTRRAFRHIFDDARDRIGFDTAGEKLLVQLYTSREGGCEIFVTKLGCTDGAFPADPAAPSRGAMTAPEEALWRRVMAGEETRSDACTAAPASLPARLDAKPAAVGGRQVAIAFPSLSVLLAACHRLRAVGYGEASDAYIDGGSREPASAYLFLKVPDHRYHHLPDRYAFLSEYGRCVDPFPLRLYVSEHGRAICAGHAVETLGDL